MSTIRIALANIRVPATPQESVFLTTSAIAEAGSKGALVICFPECFVPGYRWSSGREHMLLCIGELRERGFRHNIRSGAPRWIAALLSALWATGLAGDGSGPPLCHRTTRLAVPDVANVE